MTPPDALYLVDGSWLVMRAHTAPMQAALATSSGLPTKATFVFASTLRRLARERKPARLAVVFDAEGPTFRDEMFAAYKATRPPMPEELRRQWPYIPRVAEALGAPVLRVPGVEADDVIATLARRARAKCVPVVIVSRDKDLMQIVGEGVSLWDAMGDETYGPREVERKWGVPPTMLGDLLALVGDTSDNVPGVPGVGPKNAAALLAEFGTLEGVLAAGDRILRPKVREAIAAHAEDARLARRLVALRDDVPLPVDVEDLRPRPVDPGTARPLFEELQFTSLLAEMDLAAGAGAATGVGQPIDRAAYRTVLDEAALDEVVTAARAAEAVAVDTETTSLDAVRADLVGISLAWGEGQAAYVPVGHAYLGAPRQLPGDLVLAKLRPLLEDPAVAKYGQNHKYDLCVLMRHGGDMRGVRCDPMIASYLLDPGRASHGLDALAREHLGHETIKYADVTGRGKSQIGFQEVDVARATEYSGEDADLTWRLARLLLPRVEEEKQLGSLLHDVEIPLARVLAVMELHGVRVDVAYLASLGVEAARKLEALEAEIHHLAGYKININSPVQLRALLFERLGLPAGRRTKSGPSTDADVLEDLAPRHPIPQKILDYRAIAKLKSTYMDALPQAVNPRTGRLHTSYNQAVAATGRLSASEPNVQNIPVRTDLGREIRRAFVAEAGCVLVSCDYSQIELRVLAHFSQDPVLIDTFARDQDVHARTAAEIFGVDVSVVSPEMRRIAKSVVYGLSYGQTDYGLSQSLGISKADARAYIETFFRRYERLAAFLESLVERVRRGEPARTILGRRRFVPDIHAENRAQRGYAERIAMNTPIQGTAADILKLAMIRAQAMIDSAASGSDLRGVKMLLTVHDELVFEVPAASAERAAAVLRRAMESVMELRVALKVDVGAGPTWADAH